jgi:signal transduction histidine kinase
VESQLGRGSQFTVVLPVDVAAVVDAALYAA